MSLYEIPDSVKEEYEAYFNIADCMSSIVGCFGGWPVADGYCCTRCGSVNPSDECLDKERGTFEPGESIYLTLELSHYEVEDKKMPVKKVAKKPDTVHEYQVVEANSVVSTIEVVYGFKDAEAQKDVYESIERALDELRAFGAAEVVKVTVVTQDFDSASEILTRRKAQ